MPGVFNPFGLIVRGDTPDCTLVYDEAQTLSACGFVRRGYSCTGWSTEKNGGDFFPPGTPVMNLWVSFFIASKFCPGCPFR